MHMSSSTQYYDKASDSYEAISASKSFYIAHIDSFIINQARTHQAREWLDVGSGDGKRLVSIIPHVTPDIRLTVVEPSPKMLRLSKESLSHLGERVQYSQCSIEQFGANQKYDFITCLWNVIGHSTEPLRFMQAIRSVKTPGGVVIFDCNNSFNISQYGTDAMKNIIRSLIRPRDILSFTLRLDEIKTTVKILNPHQVLLLLKQAGFTTYEFRYVSYQTGRSASKLSGQMLILAK